MGNKINFIKVFNGEIAKRLIESGFDYVKQEINDSQVWYAFEESEDILHALMEIMQVEEYGSSAVAIDGLLYC